MLLQLVRPAFARRLGDYRCIVDTMQTGNKKPTEVGKGNSIFAVSYAA